MSPRSMHDMQIFMIVIALHVFELARSGSGAESIDVSFIQCDFRYSA